jgi:hypothetical protein
MKLLPHINKYSAILLLLNAVSVLSHDDDMEMDNNNNNNNNMDMDMMNISPTNTLSSNSIDSTESISLNTSNITPTPWAMVHAHGVPILDTKLTPQQKLYWENYNTTTYFTIESPYKPYLHGHIVLLVLSAFVFYPFVLILNNLESNWFLPLLFCQASLTLISCIFYSIFINSVEDLYPNMSYSKMITGLVIITLLQLLSSTIFSIKRWLYPSNSLSYSKNLDFQPLGLNIISHKNIPLQNLNNNNNNNGPFSSPSSTLFDDDIENDTDSLNLDNDNEFTDDLQTPVIPNHNIKNDSKVLYQRNALLEKLSSSKFLKFLASSFGNLFTILHNLTLWALLFYFFILIPNGVACLNLLGKGKKVFNLLAHWIKGGVFILLGILSLARYCGCFAGIGGAWNYAYIDLKKSFNNNESSIKRINTGMGGIGSGGTNISNSVFTKLHKILISNDTIKQFGGMICSFESIESFLIFFYGCTNVFLEHLASPGGAWTAKDLQHVSIAFMYFGAGLCGLLAEFKLFSWRRSLFFNVAGKQLALNENIEIDENLNEDDENVILGSNKLITPGFSPNPFPVFTIFWTGLLMSKHAQASALSTEIHVQWGSLLTYGSFFRIFTFLFMSYYPLRNSKECFHPAKPLTELITSFCLLCGGLVFMESTDQVIEALAYRGLTPMFTINVSVGIISLVMAWIMIIFAIKDKLRFKKFNTIN